MEAEVILLIDNYDSFTYNLYHYLGELGAEVKVFRNNKIGLEEIALLRPEKIVISPGPCTPKQAGTLEKQHRSWAFASATSASGRLWGRRSYARHRSCTANSRR
jgi:anthranilate/para-aminobenzoate synthase component II